MVSRIGSFQKKRIKRERKKPTCYKCGEVGHMIAECPKMNKNKFKGKDRKGKSEKNKKKAFKATWDYSSLDDSSSEEEMEVRVNFCLMAKREESSSPTDDMVTSNFLFFDELQDAYDELCDSFSDLMSKYKHVKKEAYRLRKIEHEYLNDCIDIHANLCKLNAKFDVSLKENETLRNELNMLNSNVSSDALNVKVNELTLSLDALVEETNF